MCDSTYDSPKVNNWEYMVSFEWSLFIPHTNAINIYRFILCIAVHTDHNIQIRLRLRL